MTQVFLRACRCRPSLRWRAVLPALLAAWLVACSSGLEWRQLRPEGWRLAFALPCRPASQTRLVPLPGASVPLQLLACRADGHTFAVASAAVADPAQVGPTLAALGAAALANVRGQVESDAAARVIGMTPQPAARHWQLRGQLPDGQAVREQVLVFAHGLRVFQATLVGPRSDAALARPFFESIEVIR